MSTAAPRTYITEEPIVEGKVARVRLEGRGLVPCLITGLTGRDGVTVRPLKPRDDAWDTVRRVPVEGVWDMLDPGEIAKLELPATPGQGLPQ